MSAVDPVEIGCFGKTFGVLGWIKVISFTVPVTNILKLTPWLINKNGLWQEVLLEESKEQVNGIMVKLPNCNSPEQASKYTNIKIAVDRNKLPKLSEGEYYWDDLVGLEVVNKDNISLGIVKSLMETGSNDVLVVQGEKRILVPYTSEVILNVDLTSKVILVDWEKDYL